MLKSLHRKIGRRLLLLKRDSRLLTQVKSSTLMLQHECVFTHHWVFLLPIHTPSFAISNAGLIISVWNGYTAYWTLLHIKLLSRIALVASGTTGSTVTAPTENSTTATTDTDTRSTMINWPIWKWKMPDTVNKNQLQQINSFQVNEFKSYTSGSSG